MHEFVITADLRKSCLLASGSYKDDLAKQKENEIQAKAGLKRKVVVEELEMVKRKKQGTSDVIKELRKCCDKELLKADANDDDEAKSKAAAFLKAAIEKEAVLEDLEKAQKKIELDLSIG